MDTYKQKEEKQPRKPPKLTPKQIFDNLKKPKGKY